MKEVLGRCMWIAWLYSLKMQGKPVWLYKWWYAMSYGENGVYAKVYRAKCAGQPWAQPFGEGEAGVRIYLGGKWNNEQSSGAVH